MFMSLKLLKLRWKIFFWTITGKINKFQSRLQLTLTQGNPEKILIIFPSDEPSFRVAYYTFRDLGKKSEHKVNFIFLIKEQFKDLFHLRIGETIYFNDSKSCIRKDKNDKNIRYCVARIDVIFPIFDLKNTFDAIDGNLLLTAESILT